MIFTLKNAGIALIFLGLAVLAAVFAFRLTFVNYLLIAPLCAVIAGLGLYVWGLKRSSPY